MAGYTIGKVSKILQMPEQTLRFLEQKGLVNPQRDESNGYRRYSLEDVNRLVDYRWYRDAGYTLNESVDAIVGKDLFQYAQQMREMQERATREARRQMLIAQRLESYAAKLDMDYLASHLGVCEIMENPELYWCINAVTYKDRTEYKSASQLEEWFAVMLSHYCFASHVFCIYTDSMKSKTVDYGIAWGYGIERKWVDALDLSMPKYASLIAVKPSVHVLVRVEEASQRVDDAVLPVVQSYLEDEGLVLTEDIWGRTLTTINERGSNARYVEAWAPVEA